MILSAEIQKRQSTSGSDSSDQRSGSCTTRTTQHVQTRSSLTIRYRAHYQQERRSSLDLSVISQQQQHEANCLPVITAGSAGTKRNKNGTRTEQKTAVPDQQTISPEQKLCNSQNDDERTHDRQRSAGSRTADRQTDEVQKRSREADTALQERKIQTRSKQRPVWKYHRRSVLDHEAISRRRNAAGKTAYRQKILIQ